MSTPAAYRLPLVLLHGMSDSSACWSSVVARFAGTRRIVALDARGHGGAPLSGPVTTSAMAADVAGQLRALGIGRAVVMGHSMGGATAGALAVAEPDLVAALVLEDPAWLGEGPHTRVWPSWLVDTVRDLAGRTPAELRAVVADQVGGWPLEDQAAWVQAKALLDPRLSDVPCDWGERDWLAEMARVRVPVTLLTCDEGAGIVNPAVVERLAGLVGRAPDGLLTHVPVPGTGHNIRRDDPEAVLAAVADALARADAAA